MRNIPAALQAKLDCGVTTLAQAWKLSRRDGTVLGFTDHDRDLSIDGVTCRAGTGFGASEASMRFDLSVDGGEVAGALDDEVLTEADLAAGRYDAAGIEAWLIDWSDVTLRLLVARGRLGEVRREGTAFTAELRGQADLLSQESGRLYTAKCGADLGDARCRVDLASSAYRGSGSVASVEGTSLLSAAGLDGFADRWFSAGRLNWTSGGNAGLSIEIKLHRHVEGEVRLTLWQAMPEPVAGGRCLHAHRRLRQAAGDLPRPLRQRRQFSRLPAYPRQRLRPQLSQRRHRQRQRRVIGAAEELGVSFTV